MAAFLCWLGVQLLEMHRVCNKEKRDRMTLTGLQAANRNVGYLRPENEAHIQHGRGAVPRPSSRLRR